LFHLFRADEAGYALYGSNAVGREIAVKIIGLEQNAFVFGKNVTVGISGYIFSESEGIVQTIAFYITIRKVILAT